MHLTAGNRKIMVSADGTGIVSQAGGLLLTQALRQQAWTAAWRRRWNGGGRPGGSQPGEDRH